MPVFHQSSQLHSFPRLILGALLSVSASIVPLSASAGEEQTIKTLKISESKKDYSISGEISLPRDAHAKIWDDHKRAYDRMYARMREDFADADMRENAAKFGPYSYEMTSLVAFGNEALLSTEMNFSSYTGGAHGFAWTEGHLYNAKTGTKLGLGALILNFKNNSDSVKALTDYIISDLQKQKVKAGWLKKGEKDEWITAIKPKTEWLKQFTLYGSKTQLDKAGGITILYAPYAVGPYAAGPYEVKIPGWALAPYLRTGAKPYFETKSSGWTESSN